MESTTTHSPARSYSQSYAHSLTHLITYASTHSLTHPLTHSPTGPAEFTAELPKKEHFVGKVRRYTRGDW